MHRQNAGTKLVANVYTLTAGCELAEYGIVLYFDYGCVMRDDHYVMPDLGVSCLTDYDNLFGSAL